MNPIIVEKENEYLFIYNIPDKNIINNYKLVINFSENELDSETKVFNIIITENLEILSKIKFHIDLLILIGKDEVSYKDKDINIIVLKDCYDFNNGIKPSQNYYIYDTKISSLTNHSIDNAIKFWNFEILSLDNTNEIIENIFNQLTKTNIKSYIKIKIDKSIDEDDIKNLKILLGKYIINEDFIEIKNKQDTSETLLRIINKFEN